MIVINDLSEAITNVLKEYEEEVTEKVDKSAKKASQKAARELRSSASTPEGKRGDYRKSWTSKKLADADYVVHAKAPEYRLTHLLEKGHAKVNGKGRTKALPHIAPVETAAIADFERILREELAK